MKKRHSMSSIIQKADAALKVAVAKVINDHAKAGIPLAIWRDGKAVWVSASRLGVGRRHRKAA